MKGEHATGLETLYRDVGPGLLAFLRRTYGDEHAAEDLLQETFFEASRRLERLAEAVSPRAWLFAIARNVAATARRRWHPVVPVPADLPAPGAADSSELDAMRQAIAELPDAMREALELRLRAELSYEEIAAVLEIPVGTVRSRLHHAVRQLRAALL